MKEVYWIILLFCLAFSSAILINEINISFIKKNKKEGKNLTNHYLIDNKIHGSIDDADYLTPADNFLIGNGWKNNRVQGNGAYYFRTPGYPLLYLIPRLILDKKHSRIALIYFQIFLFSLSVICLYRLIYWSSLNIIVARTAALIYGVLPLSSGYLYYNITEGITPQLMLLYLYFLFRARRAKTTPDSRNNYLMASLIIGFSILTRPVLGIAGILLPLFYIMDKKVYLKSISGKLNFLLLGGGIPFILISIWAIRNYTVDQRFVPLETAYHPESVSRYKPEFKAFWDFTKCWGEDGANMNKYHIPFWQAAINGDTSDNHINLILANWPEKVIEEFGKERLFESLKDYQKAINMQSTFTLANKQLPAEYMPIELNVAETFQKLTSEYKQKYFIDYWFNTSFKYMRDIVFHSNTAVLFIFQEQNRNIHWLNFLRYILGIIHVFIYASIVINLFLARGIMNKAVFAGIPLAYIIFFSVYFRAYEQRYMLPLIPLMYIGTIYLCNRGIKFVNLFHARK